LTDLISRIQALAARDAQKRAGTASDGRQMLQRMREAAPDLAEFVDAYKAVFGPIKVRYVRVEGVGEMGKQGPRGVALSSRLLWRTNGLQKGQQ
jgi:hypothetical protein